MTLKSIRVLVVDDSAFARKVIREVLVRDAEIEVVGIARDGLEALEKIAELRPDVITLDLVMPDLDGIGLLKAMTNEGAPRVVIVSVSGAETDLALEALELGAFDVVSKPTPLPTDRLYELASDLISKVKAAASAASHRTSEKLRATKPLVVPEIKSSAVELVVIGTSTGGPHALTQLFKTLPSGLPVTFAIALHIPAGFTGPLAVRLSQGGAGVQVEEAVDGMELKRGHAVIAPGGMHLRVVSRAGRLYAAVSREPADSLHHPSVDVLFKSAADVVGRGAVGVVLTGMGSDGALGSAAIRKAGGRILAESASSCVVYGMPRSVIEQGSASAEAPLEAMVDLIVSSIRG